jgi:hypothetical protein
VSAIPGHFVGQLFGGVGELLTKLLGDVQRVRLGVEADQRVAGYPGVDLRDVGDLQQIAHRVRPLLAAHAREPGRGHQRRRGGRGRNRRGAALADSIRRTAARGRPVGRACR